MKEIEMKAMALIDQYKERLASKGIQIVLSKKYVETEVEARSGGYANPGQAIFNMFERAYDRKKEKEKGYHFEKNKYHSIVMTVMPLDQTSASVAECREYAFLLEKTERAHLGKEPQKKNYQEAAVLSKIEKRILKILKKADKKSLQQICQNTFWDACRYADSQKYGYKTKFCGKERFTWDMIYMFLADAVVFVILGAVWLITKWI